MLQVLEIENYAVVEKLRVDFRPGLNVLTGETGSGKSIVVDALSLLLGMKASAELVRAGAERARVAGVFELEPGELLIEREILANGKSRAFVGGRLATVSTLREMAPRLGDIHGQHEQQELFSVQAQIEMLDEFCGASAQRERAGELFAAWTHTGRRIEELHRAAAEGQRMLDLWKFEHQEITQAALAPGEDQRLEDEKRVLANLERILATGHSAWQALYDSPAAATSQVKTAARALEDVARFHPDLSGLAQTLQGARLTIEEAAGELRRFLDRLEADPGRLAQIEDRLDLIGKLKRKYGASVEQIQAAGQEAQAKIARFESSEATIRQVEQERARLAAEYEKVAGELSARRREGARRLEKPMEMELAALAMERTRLVVDFAAVEPGNASWTARGVDRVQFLISPNPGEPPRPLALVASGGEISRITLALKSCLLEAAAPAARRAARTLVFDEIDAGIGGRAAEAVGRRLKRLAQGDQLLCVTHLPQIARFADHHFFVDKKVKAARTVVTVQELLPDERVQELARMLSGEKVTTDAIRHAEQLLRPPR